jgi:putative nucleotidyltransferase with HDIG domain
MKGEIEACFRDFVSSLQIARLYPAWHPEFKKSIDKAYISLQEALSAREGLVMGIVGEELVFEKEIFFALSKIGKSTILYLKERGIERIEFLRGLENEELGKFIAFLVTPKEELNKSTEESLSLLGIKNIIAGKIKVSSSTPSISNVEKLMDYFAIYEDSLDKVTHSLDTVLNEEALDQLVLRFNLANVMDNLLGRYQDFLSFGTMKRFDTRTYFHTMNVSILSMYFSSKIGFSKEEILDIGTAALFHDIGKLYISRKIIKKSTRLTEDEFTKIKNHVILGTEILLKYVDVLGILPVLICFEHHLKYDLSGYPKLSFYQRPHILSMIVSICDVYDALSQRRSYKNDYPPKMIYDLMMRNKGRAFEPQLLDRFFKVIGVWPVGTIVRLNDGRIAVVREENEDDIFSPRVEVIRPPDKKETIDLITTGGKFKIEDSLDLLNEGKEYLALI